MEDLKNMNTDQLNEIIRTCSSLYFSNISFPLPINNWNKIELYSGIAYIGNERILIFIDLNNYSINSTQGYSQKQLVCKYLMNEGFISEPYFYIGLTKQN